MRTVATLARGGADYPRLVEPLERAMGMRWYHALELAPGA
jgi:hypothetical protein